MSIEEAYIAGVVNGDGWVDKTIGLLVKDKDFILFFHKVLTSMFDTKSEIRNYKGYWSFRISNKTGKFDYLKNYEPENELEKCAWIQGLFDSEGNVTLRKTNKNQWERRISIYSTNLNTLDRSTHYLSSINLETVTKKMKNSAGHKGAKIVYELEIRQSKEAFKIFSEKISSNIKRKKDIIDKIPDSYQPNKSYLSKGAILRANKTKEITLPKVLNEINILIQSGIKVTQKECMKITDYRKILHYYKHSDIINMIKKE